MPRLPPKTADSRPTGVLVVNADDWGMDRDTTERSFDCIRCRSVSAVSAMVFMKDSERAAAIARDHEVDAGLHLNFTTPFSAAGASLRLIAHQERLTWYLRSHRYAQVVPHPGLTSSFDYVVRSQFEEFARLYGTAPNRIDGHHHMHLCANVVLRNLLPIGTIVRRNFSFQAGEKWLGNRIYRQFIDGILRRRHQLVDYLFTLPPLEPIDRLHRIFDLARQFLVEVEAHPVNPEEYRFLMGSAMAGRSERFPIAPRIAIARCDRHIAA